METVGVTLKAAAMGNRWLTGASRKRDPSCNMPCRVVSLNIWTLQPWLGTLQLMDFPKTEIFWNGRDFRPSKNEENMTGQIIAIGRTVWGPKVPPLQGIETSLSYVQCLVSCVFFHKCLNFSHSMNGYTLDRPCAPQESLCRGWEDGVVRKAFWQWTCMLGYNVDYSTLYCKGS